MTEEENELGLLNAEEAAKLLRVTKSSIDSFRMSGGLPFVKLGKRIFYKRDALAKFVDDQQFTYEKSGE